MSVVHPAPVLLADLGLPVLLADGEWIVQLLVLLLFFGGGIIRLLMQLGQGRGAGGRRPIVRLEGDGAEDPSEQMRRFLRRSAGLPEEEEEEPFEAEVVAPAATPVSDFAPSQLSSGNRNSTDDFAEGAGHLGEEVGLADDMLESHLKATFEHEVGSLGDSSDAIHEQPDVPEGTAAPLTAADIASAIADPAEVRRAIIMAEILNRPESRWGAGG